METIAVELHYTESKNDMMASGSIGDQSMALGSDGSFLRSDVKVVGTLGTDAFMFEGRVKNLVNRDFSVAGTWAGSPMEVSVKTENQRYAAEGTVNGQAVALEIRAIRGELHCISAGNEIDLHFHAQGAQPLLEGTTTSIIEAAVAASLVPFVLRNISGSMDSVTSPSTAQTLGLAGNW